MLANGSMSPKEIITNGREPGHAKKTLRRAFKEKGGKW